jgi:hypothetical protein
MRIKTSFIATVALALLACSGADPPLGGPYGGQGSFVPPSMGSVTDGGDRSSTGASSSGGSTTSGSGSSGSSGSGSTSSSSAIERPALKEAAWKGWFRSF